MFYAADRQGKKVMRPVCYCLGGVQIPPARAGKLSPACKPHATLDSMICRLCMATAV